MKVAWLDMWWFTLKGFVTDLVFEDATSLPVQPASVLPPPLLGRHFRRQLIFI